MLTLGEPSEAPVLRTLLLLSLPLALPAQASNPDAGETQDTVVRDVVLPVVQDQAPLGPDPEPAVEVDANGFLVGDPTNALDLLEKAVTTRNYFFGAAALLMLLVVVVKAKWKSLPPDMIPGVTLVLTAVPGLVLVLTRPGVNMAMVGKQVFIIWLMTHGFWEALGKRLFETWLPRLTELVRPAVVMPAAVPAQPPAAVPVVQAPPPSPPETPPAAPAPPRSRMS